MSLSLTKSMRRDVHRFLSFFLTFFLSLCCRGGRENLMARKSVDRGSCRLRWSDVRQIRRRNSQKTKQKRTKAKRKKNSAPPCCQLSECAASFPAHRLSRPRIIFDEIRTRRSVWFRPLDFYLVLPSFLSGLQHGLYLANIALLCKLNPIQTSQT